eukprot:1003100-Alexandrium_andersonii.AAC.1
MAPSPAPGRRSAARSPPGRCGGSSSGGAQPAATAGRAPPAVRPCPTTRSSCTIRLGGRSWVDPRKNP